MDKKSKILLAVLLVLFLISAFLSYYRFFVSRNYEVMTSEGE